MESREEVGGGVGGRDFMSVAPDVHNTEMATTASNYGSAPALGKLLANPIDKVKDTTVIRVESGTNDCAPGTPKLSKVLSRKNSLREERISIVCSVEGGKASDHVSKGRQTGYLRLLFPFSSTDKTSLPLMSSAPRIVNEPKTPRTPRTPRSLQDASDGQFSRNRHMPSFDSRKIVFLFASVSCMGTLILIFLTLRLRKNMQMDVQ